MKMLEERFVNVTLEGKLGKVISWSSDEEVKEIYDVLKMIDPGYDSSIRSWGQFKSKIPVLHDFFETHVRHHEYLTEWDRCELPECTVCMKFGTGLHVPNSPLARHTFLRPMDRPVSDPENKGHFVPASKTEEHIAEKRFTFEKLKAELPTKETDKHLSKFERKDKEADAKAGGSSLFKGEKVRDVVKCTRCDFPRAIYSMHALYNRTPRLPNKEKKIILQKLEDFKETYVCGDVCLVDDFVTKQNLRCGDFVEG